MSKGEMAVIVIISWSAGLVILAVLFTAAGIDPSDFPGWLLLIVWLSISKIIHAVITGLKRYQESRTAVSRNNQLLEFAKKEA